MVLFAQIMGYIGMAFIVVSFFFKNIKMLRILSLVGEVLTIFFATTLLIILKDINSFLPTLILNVALFIVNIVMLAQKK